MTQTQARFSRSTLHVVEIDPSRDSRWEAFVQSAPDATLYHSAVWLQLLHQAFQYTPTHLACEDESGNLGGILPLFILRGLITGRRYSSLPRTPLGGPLVRDSEASAVLLRAAMERTQAERRAQLQLKLSGQLDGAIPNLQGGTFRQTYTVPVPPPDQPFQPGHPHFQRGLSSNLKKATRLGVVVREATSLSDLRAWYALYLETMRTRFVPPRPYLFFELAWQSLQPRDMLTLLLAERHGAGRPRLLAGCMNLHYGQTVTYAFAGSHQADQEFRPSDLIHWHALQAAHKAGYRFYDMGEVGRGNDGLAKYKMKWGAQQSWLYRYYYPADREAELEVLESEGRLHRLASGAWQHVPLPVTVAVSTWLHKYF